MATENTGGSSSELLVGDQDLNSAAKRRRVSPDDNSKSKRKPSASHVRSAVSEETRGVELLSSEQAGVSLLGAKDVNVRASLPTPSSSSEQLVGQTTSPKCNIHHEIMQKLDILTSMVKIVDGRLLTVLSHLDVIGNSSRPSAERSSTAEQSLVPVSLEPLQFSTPSPLPPSEGSALTAMQLDFTSIKQSLSQALATSGEGSITPTSASLAVAGEFLSSEEIARIKSSSTSRMNFAAKMNRHLFSVDERKACNVRGKMGKSMLDPERIKYIRDNAFRLYPLQDNEIDWRAWSACIVAIDESNRRLNKYRN